MIAECRVHLIASFLPSYDHIQEVLVTGASGFVGTHCVQQLLREGYTVRGTVRDVNNSIKINPLKQLEGAADRLELVEADLESDKGWPQAVADCTYILHVASPFPLVSDESIIPIVVDGTLRVLRAASKTSVEKIVLTSSVTAINEGHEDMSKTFNENDWTDTSSKKVQNYWKGKTLTEKAAWDFVEKEDVKFKLTTINPTLIVGPLLHNVQGASISITIVRRFLNNEMPVVPAVYFGMVDVCDVAQAHIRAMREPRSDGLRILITYQPSFCLMDIANILRKEFSPQGYSLPRLVAPYPMLWLYSCFNKEAKDTLNLLGPEPHFDNSRAKDILGIDFMDPKESIITMAYDIIERGMAPKRRHYRGPPTKTLSS